MHYDIECFYNHIEVENSSKEFKFFLNFHDNHRNLNPFRTEWLIYDPKLLFAGAIDFVSKNEDGTLSIYDWKRCKKIQQKNQYNKFSTNPIISHIPDTNFWHYSLQLNIYKWILEHNYNETVSEMFLVCLHPDQKNYEKIKVPNLHTDIENLIEFRREQLKNKSDL